MTMLVFGSVLAQSADLLTWAAFRPVELNPLVVWLGPAAVIVKAALMVVLVSLPRATGRRIAAAPLAAAIIVGGIGAWSNLP